MPYLERDNAKIYYEVWGDSGPWVTLVNGHTRTMRDFRAMGYYLNERGWRALAIDNRGSGRTESPLDFTIDMMADDIEALWNELDIDESHLLGI